MAQEFFRKYCTLIRLHWKKFCKNLVCVGDGFLTLKYSVLKLLFALFVTTLGAMNAIAAGPLEHPFKGLKTMTLYQSPLHSYVSWGQLSYDPTISKVIDGTVDVEVNSQGIGGIEVRRLISTQIDRTKRERYYIDFDPGASNDPVFSISPDPGKRSIGAIEADHLVLPGNGFIYALSRTNREFLEHRKFFIRDGKLVEARQPFIFVGLDSTANIPFQLRSLPSAGDVVASIKKGDKVFVVLHDGSHYLVRSDFGLLGWLKVENFAQESSVIEGLYFAGD